MANYLITGTSRGLGLELASALLTRPPNEVRWVGLAARSKTPALQKLLENNSTRAHFIALEVTSPESVKAAVEEVEKVLGPSLGLDVLINNAGIMPFNPQGITKATDLMQNLEVNVNSIQLVTAGFLPLLRRGQKKLVFNIGSILGSIAHAPKFAGFPVSTYKVSKAAVNALTVQWSLELEKEGFTVISAHPGWLRTELGSDQADLAPEVGAKGILDIADQISREDTGKFFDIHVPGWKVGPSSNTYEGGVLPW
ncbi:hypothetical protein LTR84_005757 [Exophiala bonariae]|uniref:Uncharacterized protein n=1 Tax=Exophiala bonariae TaxID=1690606 RepID=A0AAV9N435_9EURO|nr:hypothetical protein LTR84_005757 [Exophiala bonariae]